MDLGLKDKVIFVAGASRGIGLGIVEACLEEGAKVAITARGAEALEATRADLAARFGAERDCQEFRVWAGIMGKKETSHGPTQRAVDSGCDIGPVAGRSRRQDGV